MGVYTSNSKLTAIVRGTTELDSGFEKPAAWRWSNSIIDSAIEEDLICWSIDAYLHPTLSTVRLDFRTPNLDIGAGPNLDMLGLPITFDSLRFVGFRNLYKKQSNVAQAKFSLETDTNGVSWLGSEFKNGVGQPIGAGGGFAFYRDMPVSTSARYIDVVPLGTKHPWFKLYVLGTAA